MSHLRRFLLVDWLVFYYDFAPTARRVMLLSCKQGVPTELFGVVCGVLPALPSGMGNAHVRGGAAAARGEEEEEEGCGLHGD